MKNKNKPAITTRIDPDLLEKLQALAYVNAGLSQREIIEQALKRYFKSNKDRVNRAVMLHNQIKGEHNG